MTKIVKKPAERKADIVKTARYLFLTKQYDKTTMQDVMEELSIAKGTIYHYFKSKEELLEAVVEDIVQDNLAQMKALLQTARGTALEKIQLLIEKGNLSQENADLLKHLHTQQNSAMHIRLLAKTILMQAELYGKLIEQGCEEGVFKTDTPLECAEFMISAVQFLTDLGIYPWSQDELLRRAKAFPQLIEQLLHAPRGSFQFMVKDRS